MTSIPLARTKASAPASRRQTFSSALWHGSGQIGLSANAAATSTIACKQNLSFN
jgi:hypothetical protein